MTRALRRITYLNLIVEGKGWHDGAMDIAGWEERYRSLDHGTEDTATRLVVEVGEKLAAGTAIDLACGAGRNALYLAERGWSVTAVDGSKKAIELVQHSAAARGLSVHTKIADLTDPDFVMPLDTFDLALIAYYLQRDLFAKVKRAVRPGGVVIAIAHIPESGERWSEKRARPGELRGFFNDWELLWDYEGPSRDPAHRRPVAEIVARRTVSRVI
jgi:tellurite methyltransferase